MPSTVRPRTTSTSFAVLGLLSVRTWTTYELTKQVARSLRWFWPRAERKLYDEPKALVAGGLAASVREYQGQRPRTVYDITDDGRAALREWLGRPPAERTTEFEAMVKVFFCDAGSLDQLTATLDAVEAEAAERLDRLREMARDYVEAPHYPQRAHVSALTMRGVVLQEAAVLEWARWARTQVQAWRTTTDPGGWGPSEHARLVELVDSLVPPVG